MLIQEVNTFAHTDSARMLIVFSLEGISVPVGWD